MFETDYLQQFVDPNYVAPPKTIYKYEPYFEYRQKGVTDENLPDFAYVFFTNRFIKNTLKQEFLDNFLIKYLTDKKFKARHDGKYIVVLNNTEYVIVNSIEDSDSLNNHQIGGKMNIYIGDLPRVRAGVSTIVKDKKEGNCVFKTSNGENISVYKQQTYKLKCALTHKTVLEHGSMAYNKNIDCIYDTGCEISYLFLPELWDFENYKFKNNIRNGTTEYWNRNNFGRTSCVYIEGANGNIFSVNLIYLKNPLYISVEGLNPVPVYYLLVPIEEPDENTEFLFLIGLDIINQLSSTISMFNGKVQLRLTNQKEEITNNFFI